MSKNIVQLNNSFIQNEYQRRRYLMKERQKRNRFMGWVLILMILLFILPTYNLAQSYQQLLQRRQQLSDLQTQYQTLSEERRKRQLLPQSWKMKSTLLNTCVQNIIILRIGKLFIRFLTCSQGDKMENLLDVIEQFLSLSDEKLEELAEKINYCVYKKKKERKNA